ncbi:carbon-nitrogen hydrolase family protein [Pseudomonas jessenii]|uniref:Carbon-nitrogen hydrolase family protein n=2 Tax=Pseudomonas jessenii TaxID=77298 RepID=A0A2W0EX03_PSEJE|nr:carbon-nitrogen hydrolase family protein [Pseudomonas jessenii]
MPGYSKGVVFGVMPILRPARLLNSYVLQPGRLAADVVMFSERGHHALTRNSNEANSRLNILIAVGAPTRGKEGNAISMITFQPGIARCTYSKQHLHADELPFFSSGTQQRLFSCASHVVAPAICYESLQADHARQAAEAGAQIYFTSVAKSERGVAAAYSHYPLIAKQHAMTVLMANCVGLADDFVGAGQSGVWDSGGKLVIQAGTSGEALVMYDFSTGKGELVGL